MYTQVLKWRMCTPCVGAPARAPWPSKCHHVVAVPIGTTQLQWFVHRSVICFLPPTHLSDWSETPRGCVDRSRCACTCTVTRRGVVPYAVNKHMERWGRTEPSHRPRGRARARAIFYGRQKELLEWRVARRGDTHPRACGVVYRLLRASEGPSRKDGPPIKPRRP